MPDSLHAIAASVRTFLEPAWRHWQPGAKPPSKNTCGRSSLFLERVLRHEGYEARWTNGIPRLAEDAPDLGPFGFFDGTRWESHAWIECDGFIVDVTADQFGAPPVLVTPATDPRYGARTLDTASPEAVAARQRTVDELWRGWGTR
ncbi:hypothetical protein [Kaistia sp. MMO-174]|uniref:hypothetical protein n=1 Tax=Kaistia sp. MMO-174 TaxID=3081256 RepID=UPI003019E3A1